MALFIVTGEFNQSVMDRDFSTADCRWMPCYDQTQRLQSEFGYNSLAMESRNSQRNVAVFTQSSDVFNGARLAKVDFPDAELFCILYEAGEVKHRIEILPTGNADSWTRGFFDQAQKDLAEIIRRRKNA